MFYDAKEIRTVAGRKVRLRYVPLFQHMPLKHCIEEMVPWVVRVDSLL